MSQRLVLPSVDDPVVAGAVEVLGGPPGRHARLDRRRFWTPVRVLLALTLLTCLAGWLQKSPCRDGSTWVHEHQYTRACYTDVVALYSSEGLSTGQTPYYDHPVEYPVVTGAVMLVTSQVANVLDGGGCKQGAPYATALRCGRLFYDVTWALLTFCALVVVVTLARLSGRRPWDAALFALAPALAVHGTTNWDLLAVALAGMALAAWAAKRPVAAGLLLGLATATKLYPVLFLVPLFLLCLRAGKLRVFTATALATVGMAAAVTLPVYLTAPSYADVNGVQTKVLASPLDRLGDQGLSALKPKQGNATNAVYRFFELNTTRGADWDSLYLQLQHLRSDHGLFHGVGNAIAGAVTDTTPTPHRLNTIVALMELLLVGLLFVLTWRAARRPRLPQLLFLMVAGFLLVNKVDSPQYVLWLLPLAVLARPRWRVFLVWQAAEALVMLSRFYFFVGNDKPGQGISISWFFAAILLRDASLVGYAGLVVRDILRPDGDVVRADGVDDPAGGVLDGVPDRA